MFNKDWEELKNKQLMQLRVQKQNNSNNQEMDRWPK